MVTHMAPWLSWETVQTTTGALTVAALCQRELFKKNPKDICGDCRKMWETET